MSQRIAPLALLGSLSLSLAALAPSAIARGETPLERAVQAFEAGKYAAVVESAAVHEPTAPDYSKLQYLVGEALLLLQRPSEAKESFQKVVQQRPKAVPALVGLGRACARMGEFDAAAAPIQKALELEPKDVQARAALGELQLRKGELEEARKTLAEVCKEAPDDVLATQLAFETLLRLQDSIAAAKLAEDYSQRRPDHPLGYFLLAVIMERDGADAEAIAQYQLALSKDDTFLDAHKNLAILCHTLSDTYKIKDRVKLAYEHYKRYFELGGGDAQLRAMYDQLLAYKDQILGS